MPQPLISVCIPVYNGEKYVAETINSVQRQTYSNIEILIQDNASTDNTWPILQSLAQQDSRLFVRRNNQNCGMAGNWNIAINRARGDYVMLLSADDLLLPEFIEKCLTTFQERKVDAVATNHFYLKSGKQIKRKLKVKAKVYQNFSHLVLLFNPFSINFTLFSRQLVNQLSVGGNLFSKSYYTCDYDLWIRLALSNHRVAYLDESLGVYRVHDENLSKQVKRMSRQAALTIFSHKKALKKFCPIVYRATLFRFVLRSLRDGLRYNIWDSQLLCALKAELLR
jgi:glycosyltransferase involved in cell wall biosynthesis